MSIEAMKLALEALKKAEEVIWAEFCGTERQELEICNPAITALRQAIEQAEQDQNWNLLEATQGALREHMAEIKRLRGLLEQAEHIVDANKMVEQAQPVAWMCSEETHQKSYSRFSKVCEDHWNIPVYTSPPQRKPLTYPQIHELDWPDGVAFEDILLFVQAIEAAHGITSRNES